MLEGWAKAVEGDAGAGLTQLRRGLDALKATGAELRLPFVLWTVAEVVAWPRSGRSIGEHRQRVCVSE